MIRTARIARPWALCTRSSHSSAPSPPRRPPRAPPVDVDDLCIPLQAPYAIADYLPAPSATPALDRPTLLKLHRLAALEPPTTDEGWADLDDLDDLVAIVQAVRGVDTSALGLKDGEMVDARVRAEPPLVDWSAVPVPEAAQDPPAAQGQELLKLAKRTEGAYYVAPMPENVRTRKRSASSEAASALSEDEY
ncbi:hypothetical protein JCM3770_000538 [Rhodotorula araucariae]